MCIRDRRYHVQEVEPAPDKETYLYYSTQRPSYIGTYPNSYFNPVSYTHLDVYKRQGLPGAGPGNCHGKNAAVAGLVRGTFETA